MSNHDPYSDSMSDRVTVQSKIGRNATTNPLDERIGQDQGTGSNCSPEGSGSGTLSVTDGLSGGRPAPQS